MVKPIKQPDPKRLTVRIPFDLWTKARRLEEVGKIRSIQDALIKGLQWMTKQ